MRESESTREGDEEIQTIHLIGSARKHLILPGLNRVLRITVGCFQPDIPTLENYFTHFDGKRFLLQPWLREIFPEDEIEDT